MYSPSMRSPPAAPAWLWGVCVACACALLAGHASAAALGGARPRRQAAPAQPDGPPEPYEYKYDVEEQEKQLYFGANENGDASGKVLGAYHVLLPDGRLMTVQYSVEGEGGFVPKITFEDNASPFGKGK